MAKQIQVFAIMFLVGLAAGGVLAVMNTFWARPYVDRLAELYIEQLQADGGYDEDEFSQMLQSLYWCQTVLPFIFGLLASVLLALGHLFSKSKSSFNVVMGIAGAAWFSLFVVPVIKYPLPAVAMFNPEAATSYDAVFVTYGAVSGISALGLALGFAKIGWKNWYFGAAGIYLAIVAAMYFFFPSHLVEDINDVQLINAWRSSVAAGMTAFWFVLGISGSVLLGWEKNKRAGEGI